MRVKVATIISLAVMGGYGCARGASGAPAPAIGEQIIHVVDHNRVDPLATGHPREWMATLLYPAKAPADSVRESYFPDRALLAELLHQTTDEAIAKDLRQSANGKTDIRVEAQPDPQPHPLLLLSPGYGVVGRNYVNLASAFVRKGFVVAIVDHPYLGLVRLPDGRFLRASDDPAGSSGDPAKLKTEVTEWSRDLSVVLDRLLDSPDNPRGPRLDSSRIAAVGHSSGGTIALDACGLDRRVKACIDFDGTPEGSQTEVAGPGGPTLVVLSVPEYSDEQLKQLGRTRESQQKRRQGVFAALETVLAKGTAGPAWIATVRGGGHMSFSDAPEVSPSQLNRFGGTYMSASHSRDVYVGLAEAFVRAYFPDGGGTQALERFQARTPEVKFVSVPKAGTSPST